MIDNEDLGLIESQISEWVRANVSFPDLKLHGRCHKVILKHLTVDRKVQGDIKSFSVKLEEGTEDEVLPLIHGIAEAAQRDADDLAQGVQIYAIYAYYPKDTTFIPRRVFRVAPSNVETDQDVSPSEPPTEKGLVAQSMRHLEAVMRTNTIATATLMQSQVREIQRLAEQNAKYSEQQLDFMVLVQDMIDGSHRRRLDERAAESNQAMKESAISKIDAILPIILNRLAGQQILPVEDPSFMMMSSFIENLSEDQQKSLMSSLSTPQKLALAEILEAYEKKKGRWLEGQKSLITQKTGVPPTEALAPLPMPTTMTVRERTDLTPSSSSDPKIAKLEQDAANFTNRFRSFHNNQTKE